MDSGVCEHFSWENPWEKALSGQPTVPAAMGSFKRSAGQSFSCGIRFRAWRLTLPRTGGNHRQAVPCPSRIVHRGGCPEACQGRARLSPGNHTLAALGLVFGHKLSYLLRTTDERQTCGLSAVAQFIPRRISSVCTGRRCPEADIGRPQMVGAGDVARFRGFHAKPDTSRPRYPCDDCSHRISVRCWVWYLRCVLGLCNRHRHCRRARPFGDWGCVVSFPVAH